MRFGRLLLKINIYSMYTACRYHIIFSLIVVVILVYHPTICVGGVYMIRSVPHPVISVEYQLIG